MENGKIVSIEDRIPKLKELRKKKANRRLIVLLSFFFLLVAAIVYFLSPLSHISVITVEGNRYLQAGQIKKTSLLTNDSSIWNVNKEEVSGRIEQLPEVKSAKVALQFPNRVEITVKEHTRIGYLVSGGSFRPIMENGRILDKLKKGTVPAHAPVLHGFKEGNTLQLLTDELDQLPEAILNSVSEIHASPTKTDPFHVVLYMNDGYEVSATSRTLADKLVHYPSIVAQLDPNVKGVIDLEVGSYFKAYEKKNAGETKGNQ